MEPHSGLAGFLQVLARQMIAGGALWIWFTSVQLVMLPDESMRTVWYLAGAGLVATGAFIIRSGHGKPFPRLQMPIRFPRILSSILGG